VINEFRPVIIAVNKNNPPAAMEICVPRLNKKIAIETQTIGQRKMTQCK
jgi:hypothetical protein